MLLYRYQTVRMDEWGEIRLKLLTFPVVKESAASIAFSDDEEVLDANGVPIPKEDDSSEDGEDTITCTVPGQKAIILRPNEFQGFSEEYTGVWSVTLSNGNYILLPMQYTTILDSSMDVSTI